MRHLLTLSGICIALLAVTACGGGDSEPPPLAIAASNLDAEQAHITDTSVVIALNRKPGRDDPELTLVLTDAAGEPVPASRTDSGRHLCLVPHQPLQADSQYQVSLPQFERSWSLRTAAVQVPDDSSAHWEPAVAGLLRPAKVRHLTEWQGWVLALYEGPGPDGLYSYDTASASWTLLHESKARAIRADEEHCVLIGSTGATPLLADGSLGTHIDFGFRDDWNGFESCVGAGRLYVYDDDGDRLVSIDLANGTRTDHGPASHGEPSSMAVDATGSLLVSFKHGPKDWWHAHGHSADEKVDGGNWDPVDGRWRYEQAVYRLEADGTWTDVTATLQVGNMTDGISPGPVGLMTADADGAPLLVSTEQGIWRWRPTSDDWQKVVAEWGNSRFSLLNDHTVTRSRAVFEAWDADFIRARQIPDFHDGSITEHPLLLSDGTVLLAGQREITIPGAEGGVTVDQGPYRLFLDPDSPSRSYNLDLDFAGILGEEPGNDITACEVLPDGVIAVIGTFGGAHQIRFHDNWGQQLAGTVGLSARPTDADVDGDGRIAIATLAGPVLLAADRSSLQEAAVPVDGDGAYSRIDIDGKRIAFLADKTVHLFDDTFTPIDDWTFGHSYVTDVALDAAREQLAVVGFDNKRNGNPVQLPVARAFSWSSGSLAEAWYLWRYDPAMLDHDMADSRLYRVLYAPNGDCYVSGETAGGNTVFRWNGVDLESNTLVKTDPYTDPWQTRSEHKLYYGRIDPDAGRLRYGQMCFPRKSDFEGNTFTAKNGDLVVAADGTLYVTGACAARMQGRDLNRINGAYVGPYSGGDLTLLMVSPDFRHRLRWTCFSAPDSEAGGGGRCLALGDGFAVIAGQIGKGAMVTTDGSVPLAPDGEDDLDDAWMAIWNPAQDQEQIAPGAIATAP
ncbi:MAG: hypothetical protein ACOCXJ_01395 [Planctomycetota bacterium]